MPDIAFPSVIPNLPEADYHSHRALGSSLLKRLDKFTPAKAAVPFAGNKASDLGTLFHLCIVAGQLDERIMVTPKGTGSVAKTKELKLAGMLLVSEKELNDLLGMIGACRAHPFVRDVLENETFVEEVSAFTRIGETEAKCRLDLMTTTGMAIDWKTAREADEFNFEKAIATYRYHIQEAHYRNVWNAASVTPIRSFYFVAVESEPPYLTGVYQIDESWYREGLARWNRALARYRLFVKAGLFPSLPDEPVELSGPNWDFKLTERDASGLSGAR